MARPTFEDMPSLAPKDESDTAHERLECRKGIDAVVTRTRDFYRVSRLASRYGGSSKDCAVDVAASLLDGHGPLDMFRRSIKDVVSQRHHVIVGLSRIRKQVAPEAIAYHIGERPVIGTSLPFLLNWPHD